jgi:hypothetical protein
VFAGYGLESVVPEMSQSTDIVTVGGKVRGAITSTIAIYRERRDDVFPDAEQKL